MPNATANNYRSINFGKLLSEKTMSSLFTAIIEMPHTPALPTQGSLQLFDDGGCIYAHRCKIALHEVGAAHEIIRLPMIKKPDWYVQIHAENKVPALRNSDGKALTDSVHISNYIAEAFTDTINLLPGDAWLRAEIRLFIQRWHDLIWGHFPKILMEGDIEKRETLKREYLDAMAAVNALLLKNSESGPWAFGEQFTLADVIAAPHLSRFFVLRHFENWEIPANDDRFARVLAWKNAVSQRASVVATSLPEDDYIALYQNFVNLREQRQDVSAWKKPTL
jgi:glutathione S-transferase